MKIIRSSTTKHSRTIYAGYEEHHAYTRGNSRVKFSVYLKNAENPDWLEMQISEIHPYDDAEYVWAKMGANKQVKFIQDGNTIDKMQIHDYDPDDYESVQEYIDEIVDTVALELRNMNEDVEPNMIHN